MGQMLEPERGGGIPGTDVRAPGDSDAARRLRLPRWPQVVSGLPLTAGLIAEGAWIAVPVSLMQAMSERPAILGPVPLAVVAAAGYLMARWLADRLGPLHWPIASAILLAVAAVVGWLADPDVRAAVVAGDGAAAIARHPGGWLAGLAFFRGTAHAGPNASAGVAGSLVTTLVGALTLFLIVGGSLPEPQRTAFFGDALVAVTIFVAASTLAVALGRIAQVAESTGFDWQPNRAWLALLAVLVGAIVLVALPASLAVATPVQLLLQLLPAPLLVIAFFVGLRGAWRAMLAAMGVMTVIAVVLVIVSRFGQRYDAPTSSTPGFPSSGVTSAVVWPLVVGSLIVLVVLIAVVALLARYWMREAMRSDVGGVREERTIDASAVETTEHPRRRGRRITSPPTTATTAYLALLDDLEGRTKVARAPYETPAGHASRLRLDGHGATALDLLAADYELERYGELRLTSSEVRRAIGRWRRLRRTLGR